MVAALCASITVELSQGNTLTNVVTFTVLRVAVVLIAASVEFVAPAPPDDRVGDAAAGACQCFPA